MSEACELRYRDDLTKQSSARKDVRLTKGPGETKHKQRGHVSKAWHSH